VVTSLLCLVPTSHNTLSSRYIHNTPLILPSAGSSNGRGPRCAGWFADYVAARNEAEGIPETMHEPRVYTLEGGIKGWIAGGPSYRALIDNYDESYWMQFAEVKTPGKRTVEKSKDEDEEMEWNGDDSQDGSKRVKGTVLAGEEI
jgi:hypothetical protein